MMTDREPRRAEAEVGRRKANGWRFGARRRLWRLLVAVGVGASSLAALPLIAAPAQAATGDGTVTVRVVQEVNANGVVDDSIMEPPLSGVTVTLSDASGHTVTGKTSADGTVTFTPASSALTGGQYRVDATNPRPGTFLPGHAANGQSAAASLPIDFTDPANAKLSSNTEFVDVRDGQDAYVNTSFWYPPYYCQDNAAVCDAVQPWDAPPSVVSQPDEKTLISVPYELDQEDQPLATQADTGVVYGIAYDRAHKRIFSAAYAKRGSAYGPGGPGAIYVTDLTSTSYPLSGTTSQWATVPNAGADNHDMATHQDYGFYDHVGKESLGDIDITNDGRYLFGVNMFDKTAFVYDLNDDSYVDSYPIPNPCAVASDWRPMGTGTGLDTNYVGGVCSGESSHNMNDLSAHVYQFDPASGTFGAQVLNQSLDYGRGRAYKGTYCDGSVEGDGVGRWYSWTDHFPAGPNEQRAAGCDGVNGTAGSIGWIGYPEPMLDDVVEETNGDLVIAFRDRFADQAGFSAQEPNAAGLFAASGQTGAGGDVVRGCKLTDGSFVLDPNFDPAVDTLAAGSICDNNNDGSTNSGGEPATYREYYTGDWRTGYHEEAFYGGIALSRVEPNIISSGFDSTGAVWTQGIGAVGRDGALPTGNLGVRTDDGTSDQFGKGAGMADLEVLCDQAPIQIGNRVWADTDGDGIQDPGEPPLAGVTVNLYDASGAVIGTTTTDADGDYYFDASNVDGGLAQNTDYTVKLDNPDDYAAGGPLAGRVPTQADAGGDDTHDSDGIVPAGGTYPEAAVTTGGPGEDNHSYDFGFLSPVSIGDYVWIDADGDGVQDAGEDPVPGATITLLDADGNTVGTTTTDADGYYAFGDLAPGTDYTVEFPTSVTVDGTQYALTSPAQGGDDSADSNPDRASGEAPVTTPATGSNSLEPGEADDPTIDAGYVPPVSIGDYVWIDADGDGVQDADEAPVPGATVTLLDADGNPVGTTTTDSDGYYAFTDLTPGADYTVTFPTSVTVDGIDYSLTAPAQGSDDTADSNPNPATGEAPVTTPGSGDNSGEPGEADDPTIDAGYTPNPVSVGDYVWIDADGDGVQEAGEAPVPGATVTLLDADGNPVGTTTTDENGYYSFTGLTPDEDYTVEFPTTVTVDGIDYGLTAPAQGGDDTADSNPDQATGEAPVTTPKTGSNSGEPNEADVPTIDAGYTPKPVSVGDYVWIDADGDGVQDAGEAPVPGATVTLLDADGNPVGTTTTDENGYYSFTDLTPGTDYTVQFPTTVTVDGSEYVLTAPAQGGDDTADSNPDQTTGEAPVTAPGSGSNSGEPNSADNPTIDAGYTPVVSVGDYVWIDADGDGVQDAGEAPVPGATVTLLDADGNPVGTTTTDENGYYSFTDLDANTDYTVEFPTTVTVDGIDYGLTAPAQGGDDTADSNPDQTTGEAPVTTPASGSNSGAPNEADVPTIDAGYTPKPVSIGDKLWIDADGDGVQDAGEAPVPGATVTLLDADGNPVGTTPTDENGYYSFTGLTPDEDYTVEFPTSVTVDGIDYGLTAPAQGGDDTADSNPDQVSGRAPVTTPKTGDNSGEPNEADVPTIDAGYTPKPVSIGDKLWLDVDGDGVQDAGEAPVPGATVTLLDADGNPVGATTTDENGYYSFTGLTPDEDYTVEFPTSVTVDGVDYFLTEPGQGGDTAADSNPDQVSGLAPVTTPKTGSNSGEPNSADVPTIDAGYTPNPVSIGDKLWIDADGDGIQDSGEKPVPGATVTLLNEDGSVVATTTTDENGYWAFTGLVPNTPYIVQFPTTVTVDGHEYNLTTQGSGSDTAADSDPDSSTGRVRVVTPKSGSNSGAPGQADIPTIDAGYVLVPALAVTGSNPVGSLAVALMVLLGGAALVLFGRRRKRSVP